MKDQFTIDDSRMPLRLGSALRVPSYAYPNWGIPEGEYRISSDACYTSEWESGSPRQMKYVEESIKKTGFGNFSQILRDASAEIVAHRVSELAKNPRIKRINYMDVGAGVSTVNSFDAIDDNHKDRIFITLVEPSRKRLEKTASDLSKRGLVIDKDYMLIESPDQHMLAFVEPETQDILSYVATFHHHSYIDTPARHAKVTMKDGGILLIADWHNPTWEHPARVRRALIDDFDKDEFEWETKEKDIRAFEEAYPKSLEEPPELLPLDHSSYMEIRKFWSTGWSTIIKDAIKKGKFDERDEIKMLEAHRPVERQNEELYRAGFNLHPEYEERLIYDGLIKENPHQLRKESRQLMITVAQK